MKDDEEAGTAGVLDRLPPMPQPKTHLCSEDNEPPSQRQQTLSGTVIVVTVIIFSLLFTQFVLFDTLGLPADGVFVCRVLIYTSAIWAAVCLCGLIWADSGVVQRSTETCLPLPPEVVPTGRMLLPCRQLCEWAGYTEAR